MLAHLVHDAPQVQCVSTGEEAVGYLPAVAGPREAHVSGGAHHCRHKHHDQSRPDRPVVALRMVWGRAGMSVRCVEGCGCKCSSSGCTCKSMLKQWSLPAQTRAYLLCARVLRPLSKRTLMFGEVCLRQRCTFSGRTQLYGAGAPYLLRTFL